MLIQWINTGLRKIPTWVLYLILLIPGLLTLAAGLTDNLGPEPINELEEELGEFAQAFNSGSCRLAVVALHTDQSGAIPQSHWRDGFCICHGAFLGLVLVGSPKPQSHLD